MSTKIKAGTSTTGAVVDADTTGILELQSGSTPTTAVTIDANQNVGIGTTPSTWNTFTGSLQIAGASLSGLGANNTALGSNAYYNSAWKYYGTGSATLYQQNAGLHTWQYAGSGTAGNNITFAEAMRIDSSGNVLVGTTTASNKFVVSADSGGTAVAQIINTTSSGNVISVSSTLQSNGNNTSSAHYQGNTNGVGNWYLFGNGTSSYSSDERLKKNIETTRSGYLEDLCKLRVVKYNWRLDEEGKNKELGLIAQEVEQVFPNLVQDDLNPVSQDDDTIYKQLKQSVLPFMLLKAIQELNAKVDAQATVIADLTTRLETLEAK